MFMCEHYFLCHLYEEIAIRTIAGVRAWIAYGLRYL